MVAQIGLKTILRFVFIFFVVILVVGYGFFSARYLIEGPKIIVHTPKNNDSFKSSLMEVVGETENISYISLNGKTIFVNEKGCFKEKLLLSEGTDIISLYAKDKMGREITKSIKVSYFPSSS